jgi:Flp pilus assembly protein TadG
MERASNRNGSRKGPLIDSGNNGFPGIPLRQISRRRQQLGQTMVEMAFILPIFLAIVFAIIEFGRAWATKQSITLAAREGARVLVLPYGAGLTYSTEGAQQQAAIDSVRSYLASSGVVATPDTEVVPVRLLPGSDNIVGTSDDTIEQNYTNAKRGDRIGIQIRHIFDTSLPVILTMFNNGSSSDAPSNGNQVRMGVTCYLEHE